MRQRGWQSSTFFRFKNLYLIILDEFQKNLDFREEINIENRSRRINFCLLLRVHGGQHPRQAQRFSQPSVQNCTKFFHS